MRIRSLNESWRFMKLPDQRLDALPPSLPDGPWETVSLPHTWFREDDPWQGLAVYETVVRREPDWEKAFLSFNNADQCCRVFVNGCPAGEHRGGYARFRLPVPDAAADAAEWRIHVFVENRVNEEIAPSFGDFTVFGGLYRGADLLLCGPSHFDRCFHGTDGLIVRADLNASGQGVLRIEPHTVCAVPGCRVAYTLRDPQGAVILSAEGSPEETVTLTVDSPALWNGPESAPLYTVTAELLAGGEPADRTELRTGFRRVELDAQRGLLLNGRPHPLRGVAKHQDRAGVFPAASDKNIREDFALIREMGANAVRLSHYQHPQTAYDCADETGLLVWAEIPMLKMTESPALLENARQQLTELILQNIHHPSIFCWGIQNEIAMFRDAPFMHENCRLLHDTVKALDPSRFSAAANLYPLKFSSHMNELTDLVGYNLYFGWYYGETQDFGPYLDRFHAARPALPLGISEYGVDANLALHSEAPAVKDYSEEYQALWHETVWPQIESRPWLWGSFVWNMFDFSSVRRNEGGQRFLNAKGLVTHDRRIRKDAFYYYKARWSSEPFIHLCAKRFEKRARASVDVKCYTNQPAAELRVNGEFFGRVPVQNGTALFRDVPLRMGENRIEAAAAELTAEENRVVPAAELTAKDNRAEPAAAEPTAEQNCVKSAAVELRDTAVWIRVPEEEPSYRLPDAGLGGPVKNWFLADDDFRREGYYSIQSTAQDLLDNPEARAVLEKYIPALVRVMTEKSVIPLGLSLKSILSRDADKSLDIKSLNAALNHIPDAET